MNTSSKDKDQQRRRRSSSLMYHEPPESLEQQSDQAVLPNLNAQWVNAKGESSFFRSQEKQQKSGGGVGQIYQKEAIRVHVSVS